MKVFYDHQIFSWQKYGGISRYFTELMAHLEDFGITYENSLLLSDNIHIKLLKKCSNGVSLPQFKGKIRTYNAINKINSINKIRKSEFDIFHPTYYDPYFLKYLKGPFVLTVHDLTHERYPQLFPKKDNTISLKRDIITKANRIIAVSNNTKKDLIELYNIPDDKIDVIYLGYSFNDLITETVHHLPNHYILFVGQRDGYKNFSTFLKAFAYINKRKPDVHLICTGTNFTIQELKLIKSLKLDDRITSMFVSDSQLNYLYKKALCFVYPSLYEGFGIPILESFALSCPVALSNASCFPEIAQNGGSYFDPTQPNNIGECVLQILNDNVYRQMLITEGHKLLLKYSWKKMTEEIAEVYRKTIQ